MHYKSYRAACCERMNLQCTENLNFFFNFVRDGAIPRWKLQRRGRRRRDAARRQGQSFPVNSRKFSALHRAGKRGISRRVLSRSCNACTSLLSVPSGPCGMIASFRSISGLVRVYTSDTIDIESSPLIPTSSTRRMRRWTSIHAKDTTEYVVLARIILPRQLATQRASIISSIGNHVRAYTQRCVLQAFIYTFVLLRLFSSFSF